MGRNLGTVQLGGSGSGSPVRLEASYRLGLGLGSSQDLSREDGESGPGYPVAVGNVHTHTVVGQPPSFPSQASPRLLDCSQDMTAGFPR